MTETHEASNDLDKLSTVQCRFGIQRTSIDRRNSLATMEMPLTGLWDPETEEPTLAPLAVLVDAVGGTVNHLPYEQKFWTVSTELSLIMTPGVDWALAKSVRATAALIRADDSMALSRCQIYAGSTLLGEGSVRSLTIPAGVVPQTPPPPFSDDDTGTRRALSQRLALSLRSVGDGAAVLAQEWNPLLTNVIGTVHGGVVAAALELAGTTAVNAGQVPQFRTSSMTVHFLAALAGSERNRAEAMYEASVIHKGRRSAVIDARARGADGRVATIARLNAYR